MPVLLTGHADIDALLKEAEQLRQQGKQLQKEIAAALCRHSALPLSETLQKPCVARKRTPLFKPL